MAPNDRTAAADREVIKAIRDLRAELDQERDERDKAVARERCHRIKALVASVLSVVVAGVLATVIGYGLATRAAGRASDNNARANCEASNEGQRRALTQTQMALTDLVAESSPAARERAQRISEARLTPQPRDCRAEFP